MNFSKLVLLLIITFSIVACGGSGGDSSVEDDQDTPTGDENNNPIGGDDGSDNDGNDSDGDGSTGSIDLVDFFFNDVLGVDTNSVNVGATDVALVTSFDSDGDITDPPTTDTTEGLPDNTVVTTFSDSDDTDTFTIFDDRIDVSVVNSDAQGAITNFSFQRFAEIGDTISMDVNTIEAEGIGTEFTQTCVLDDQLDSFNIAATTNGVIDLSTNSFSDVIVIVCTLEATLLNVDLPDPPTAETTNYFADGIGNVFQIIDVEATDFAPASTSFLAVERL